MSKKTTSNVKSKGNVTTKNLAHSSGKGGGQGAKYVGNTPKSLGEIRNKFDGVKDVAAKMPEGAQKNALIAKIEELYLDTANWFTGLVPQATA